MSLVVRLRDNFEWEAYETAIQKIMNCKHPIVVTWDLRSLTKIPWEHLSKTLGLLVKIESLNQEHITKSILLLPNKEWKKVLKFLFKISPPKTPVELSIGAHYSNDSSGLPSYQKKYQTKVP